MLLLINTALANKIIIALAKDNNKIIKKIEKQVKYHESEKLLGFIDQLLKQAKLKLKDLKGIAVVTGPGSFTAIRIGVTVANTLAWSLDIPLRGFKAEDKINYTKISSKKLVLPHYGKVPNITKSKKKW